MKLQKEGFLISEIAEKLRVTERTVYRDLVKLRPHIKHVCNEHMRNLHDELFKDLGLLQRSEILGKIMCAKPREKLKILRNLMQNSNKTCEK